MRKMANEKKKAAAAAGPAAKLAKPAAPTVGTGHAATRLRAARFIRGAPYTIERGPPANNPPRRPCLARGGRRRGGALGRRALVPGAGGRGRGGRRGAARARSHCRFVLPFVHLIPDSRTYSVPLVLERQCDRTPGGAGVRGDGGVRGG
jgi:hypothetical protein